MKKCVDVVKEEVGFAIFVYTNTAYNPIIRLKVFSPTITIPIPPHSSRWYPN